MGRYSLCAVEDDEVEVDEAKSDPLLEPWQDRFWQQLGVEDKKEPGVEDEPNSGLSGGSVGRLLSAVVPFGRARDMGPLGSPSMGSPSGHCEDFQDDEDDDRLEEPSYLGSVHFVGVRHRRGVRSPEEKDDEDTDDGTVDLTGFYAVRPHAVHRAMPQARAEIRQNCNMRDVCMSDWAQLQDRQPELNSLHASPLSSPRNPPAARRALYWAVLAVVTSPLVAYIANRAPPPPPPAITTPASTWIEYLLSSIDGVSQNVWYILSGLAANIYHDCAHLNIDDLTARWNVGAKEAFEPCPLVVPSLMSLGGTNSSGSGTAGPMVSPVEEFLLQNIIGQDQAMRMIARGLDFWAESNTLVASEDDDDAASFRARGGKPFVVVLAGPEGVGKMETARRVSQLVYDHCPLAHDGVLELHGMDFEGPAPVGTDRGDPGDEESLNPVEREMATRVVGASPKQHLSGAETDKERLVRVVVDHLRRQNDAGAVIILRQIDRMHPSVLSELLHPLAKGSDATLSYQVHPMASHGDVQTVEASCRNVLFVLTTDLGSGSIVQAIRANRGTSRIPLPELERSIRVDLDKYFGNNFKIDDVVNVVAPFMILGGGEIQEIMRQKIKALSQLHEGKLWKRLDVTDAALHLLVGPQYMDYLRLLPSRGGTNSVLKAFSRRGAHPLDDGVLMQMLRGRAMRYLVGRPDHVAVFDISVDVRGGMGPHVTLRWCPGNKQVYRDIDKTECDDAWRERLI